MQSLRALGYQHGAQRGQQLCRSWSAGSALIPAAETMSGGAKCSTRGELIRGVRNWSSVAFRAKGADYVSESKDEAMSQPAALFLAAGVD